MIVTAGLAIEASGNFAAHACANSFLRDAAPAGGRVSAAGMYICSYYIGGTVGGVLPGLFWKYNGWPGCVALVTAILLVAGFAVVFGWRSRSDGVDRTPSHSRKSHPKRRKGFFFKKKKGGRGSFWSGFQNQFLHTPIQQLGYVEFVLRTGRPSRGSIRIVLAVCRILPVAEHLSVEVSL